ncbi:hypothetical protein OSB04_011334 [Centaurea solstitialis]|uniref:DUF659 domain-containing protein n=1 Tax=Centaurea solstitialis TaxID=347529 RepID=A0AA38TKY5_9ASTR|nr:hypothetical protein OSB04_011334 [Centaurea solstitialis]
MASEEQQTQGSSSSISTTDQPSLWDHVTRLEKLPGSGGCWKFKCNYCSEIRQGSYSRVRANLLGIKDDAYEEKKLESQAKDVELPCEAGVGFKKRKTISTPIQRAFGNGPLFLKSVNCFGEVKDRFFIAELMKEVINEVGHQNVVQIITDNAANCKANVETNQLKYEQCSWIKEVHEEALAIKNFIMNHNMRLSIFTKFTPLRLLSVADTCFASIIVMLKRLKLIKRVARWGKNNTTLHCLAHSLHPRYYSDAWLLEDSTRCAPHMDGEISQERMKCFRRLFPNDDEYSKVLDELLGQPTSSCVERNWSTYAFIHSLKRNKLTTSRAQDLVYIHNNLRLLSRNLKEDTKMWDVGGDAFDSMEDLGFFGGCGSLTR